MRTTGPKQGYSTGVTWRVWWVGVPLVVLVCGIVSYAELVLAYIQIGFLQFPPVVIGVLFFLIVGNRAVGRVAPRFGLNAREVMLIYCMILMASMVTSRGLMEKLIPALVAVNYFATETNGWRELFFHHIPQALIPFEPSGAYNQSVARLFYEKAEDASQIPWGAWVKPMAAWAVLVFFVFAGFLCLAAILRRQWVDNEKLAFPLTQLPLEFVREDAGRQFFGNPLMWLGFALPTLVFGLNGLHEYFPVAPQISLSHNLHTWLRERPWNGIYYTPIFISFAAIGFFYLLPTQALLSLWFFFVLTRIEDILGTAFGFRMGDMPLYPTRLYVGYQVAGAYVVLIGYFLYTGMPHFKRVFSTAFRSGRSSADDTRELLPFPIAVWGLILSLLGAIVWCAWAGLSFWLAAVQFLIYMGFVAVVMARSVAEGGLLMTETSFRPVDLYAMFGQKASLGARNLTLLSLLDAIFTRDQRGLVLTGFLDGLKISDGVGFRRRSLLVVFPTAIALAFVASAVIQLWLPYAKGANLMYGYTYAGNPIWAFQDYAPAVEGVRPPFTPIPFLFFLIGVGVTLFLAAMRTMYWWWPLHPLGYALSASWTLIVFWFSIFVAWGLKVPILRAGGVRAFRRFRPFFLGMVFGEFSMAVLWTGISWATKVPAPGFPWP